MSDSFIYLDNNATTALDPRVEEAMQPYYTDFYANPNSSHLFGLSVRERMEEASEIMASTMAGHSENLIYTSGATEAINLALKGLLPSRRKHIVTVATEHHAVLDSCAFLAQLGYELSILPVTAEGMLDLDLLASTVSEETLLVCVMLVNNETGIIMPIEEISRIAHAKGALMLCDATQALGKVAIDVNILKTDFLAFSAHKFYGPKGIGGLYVSDKGRKLLQPQMHGGQQQSLRSGTLNVPAIIGMSKAAALAKAELTQDNLRMATLRDRLEKDLLAIPGTFRNGSIQQRVANSTNISFQGAFAEQLIMQLGLIAVSSGSACSATTTRPSHVLTAMGVSDADALAAIRFSLGRFNREQDIIATIEHVKRAVARCREVY